MLLTVAPLTVEIKIRKFSFNLQRFLAICIPLQETLQPILPYCLCCSLHLIQRSLLKLTLLSRLCYRASKRLGYFLSSSSLQIIWRVFICVHCYAGTVGKMLIYSHAFQAILKKKPETNFTILREYLCMLHYSSMPAIEHSPIEKNKKKTQYVRTVCTICI